MHNQNTLIPAHMSVSEAVNHYLDTHDFAIEDYDRSVVNITFWGITFPLANPPQRQIAVRFHDLHHIVTGYGTDPVGEAEISAWELRRGLKVFGLYVKAIVVAGTLLGLIHSPRRTIRAWKAARSTRPLQPANIERYQELLKLSVGDLRQLYGVPPEGLVPHVG